MALRFCMITTFYPPYNFGGDGVFVQRLSNELVRRGHHVEVIHCTDSYRLLAGREPERARGHDPRVVVHGLHSRAGPLSPLVTQQTGRLGLKSRAIRHILDRGFDVIHYHNISLVGGPEVLECGQGVKLYTTHEFWLVCPTHVLFKFNRQACVRRQCLLCQVVCRRPPQWWRYSSLLGRALRQVDTFLSPSRFAVRKHEELGSHLPFAHMPYFVPSADEQNRAARDGGDQGGRPYFLFVGRLESIKGLHTLFPVFRRLGGAQLFVAGSGTRGAELQRLASGIDNVRFLGYQGGEALRELVRGARALVVPSVGYDVSPQVILESLREGTPVIVRDLGGMPELVEDSQAGWVYRSEEQLQAFLERLLEHGKLSEEYGRRGREAYARWWSPEAHIKRYLELIQFHAGKEL